MMSPLKLSVIVCGAAAGLAVAPYIVKQILPPEGTVEIASNETLAVEDESIKLDLPVVAPQQNSKPASIAAVSTPVVEEAPVRAELQLAAGPSLPTPAPVVSTPIPSSPDMTLPSLSKPEVASASLPAPVNTPRPTPSSTPEIPFRSDVEKAQELMKKLGIDTGKIDGKLGPNTKTAIRKYQKEHGLEETGEVTSALVSSMEKSVAAIPTPEPKVEISDADETDYKKSADDPANVIVRKGADEEKPAVAQKLTPPKSDPGPVPTLQTMADVRKLQERLKLAGTYEGEVDGKWGDLTRAAMRGFQENADLEVTGRPNRETWLALNSEDLDPATKVEADVDDMKISEVASEASSDSDEVVVSLNADGTADPGKAKPIATPAAVSALDRKEDEVANDSPRVRVSTPERNDDESSSADLDQPNDLAVAEETTDSQIEKLRQELEERRAEIESVSSDSTYEVKRYAPKTLETVNNMVNDFKIETVSNNPTEARERLARIDRELEKAKSESMKKKADEIVADVTESYNELKEHFPERIKVLSLKDEEEKANREKLTELVANVDSGFEAMQKDHKNQEFDLIFENGLKFKGTIDDINQAVAGTYVLSRLEEKSVKEKLKKNDFEEIEKLQDKEDYLGAAELLDRAVASDSKN